MKEWIIRLTLLFFGFMISIVALEFGLSKFPLHRFFVTTGFHEPDKYVGWKGIRGKEGNYVNGRIVSHVKMNSQGFRDMERNYERGKDVFRVIVLGDSFTEALQIPLEETFPYILEKRLNSESSSASPTPLPLEHYPRPKRFEVINLGMSGFGTDQEYLTIKHYGLKYKPDLVILAFFVGNDARDNDLTLNGVDSKPYFVLNKDELEKLPFKIKVSKPSNVIRQFKQILEDFLVRFFPNIYHAIVDVIKMSPRLEHSTKNGIPLDYYIYDEEYPPEFQNAWEITKRLILKLAKKLEMNKIRLLVVVIPNEFEFRPDIWNRILDKNPRMQTLKFDLRKPERILSKFLEANNINYLLLRSDFEQYSKETGRDLHLHYAYDNHWNSNGHTLAAELIYRKLKSDKFVSLNKM